ncbi:MAG: hypothetical protein JOZ57_04965 [Abitibacteriaceae bacterium]|nr:hypothetical protein [Abditibacteriaceae bacterium]
MDSIIVVSSLLFIAFVVVAIGASLLLIQSLVDWAISPLRDYLRRKRFAHQRRIAQHSVTVEVD